MKPRNRLKKIKRQILSFEPEPDVRAMLEKAKRAGLVQGEILNQAVRECGEKVILELASAKAGRLTSLSFNQPEFQLAGFAE